MDNAVALVRYRPDENSLARALDLCQGLQGLSAKARILIKPNLVFWDDRYPFPLYGMLTTTRIVEALLIVLKEKGCQNITIGEGTIRHRPANASTHTAYLRLGYHRFIERYGVRLIDFFDEPFVPVIEDGVKMGIARSVLEAEFLITLPVLKTHSQTKVSLGIKNLKGALDLKTRQFFHSPKVDLDHSIALLGRLLKPRLDVIDGIYGLEQGPFFFGQAHRLNAILVSKNVLAADAAACHLVGIDPEKVDYLNEIAGTLGFQMGETDLDVLGDSLDGLRRPLQWDWEWMEDGSGPVVFKEMGIDGVRIPKYDHTFCTLCSSYMNPLLVMLVSMVRRGKKPSGFEFLTGKRMQSQGGYDKTFLLGRCMIKANRSNPKIRRAIPIPGCPPTFEDLVKTLMDNGVEVDGEDYLRYSRHLMERYRSKPQFDPADFFPSES